MAGRSLPHAMLMMIPEPWQATRAMTPERRAFYEYHSSLMEPWDGPASIAFTDGTVIGAVLDRNGLRPSRYYVTKDDLVIMASEVGVLDIPPEDVAVKERLHPGRIFLVDTAQGPHRRRRGDQERARRGAPVRRVARRAPRSTSRTCPTRPHLPRPDHETVLRRQQAFGYTHEDLRILLAPMATRGEEPLGSMGTDTALAVLSDRPRLLYDYFKQLFAQVTNPPLDAIREELVTSMASTIGPEGNLLEPRPESCRQITMTYPVIDNEELAQAAARRRAGLPDHDAADAVRPGGGRPGPRAGDGGTRARARARRWPSRLHDPDPLGPRASTTTSAPIPSLLATAGVHHHLVREGTRTRCGLVLESGDAREVHHCALLLGYGAGAVNPYLAFETLDDMIRHGQLAGADARAGGPALHPGAEQGHPEGDVQDGHLDAAELLRRADLRGHRPWPGVRRPLLHRHPLAHRGGRHRGGRRGGASPPRQGLPAPSGAARPTWTGAASTSGGATASTTCSIPETVFKLQHATRSGQYKIFKEYTRSWTTRARAWPRCAACSTCGRPPRRCPSTRSSRSSRS